jgi:signal transduction histidine kinase
LEVRFFLGHLNSEGGIPDLAYRVLILTMLLNGHAKMANTTLTRAEEILEHQQALLGRQTKRLARRIHDDVSQKMTLLSLQLSLAGADEAAPADWAKSCQAWSDMVMELGQTIREITGELRASIVDESGGGGHGSRGRPAY